MKTTEIGRRETESGLGKVRGYSELRNNYGSVLSLVIRLAE